MGDKADRAAIRAKVEALALGDGLRRAGLAGSLGEGLRRLWGISLEDSDKATHKIIYPKFVTMINKIGDRSPGQFLVHTGQLSYNISRLAAPRYDLKNTNRLRCLTQEFREEHKLTFPFKYDRPLTTVRRDAAKVYDHIADLVYADWQKFAEGEPFPVDPTDGDVEESETESSDEEVSVSEPNDGDAAEPAKKIEPHHPYLPYKYQKAVATVATGLLIGGIAAYGLTPMEFLPRDPSTGMVLENVTGDSLDIQQLSAPTPLPAGIAFANDKSSSDGLRILTLAGSVGVSPATYDDALDSGAYIVGEAEIPLKLSVKHPGDTIELVKVRALEISDPVATGIAIRRVDSHWPPSGANYSAFAERAGILLDASADGHVDAHAVDPDLNLAGPYLDGRSVPIDELHSPQLILDAYAQAHAYRFSIELEYKVNGQLFSQVVNLNGKPFRVSADICMTTMLRSKLAESVQEFLYKLRYAQVASPDGRPGAIKNTYTTFGRAPDSFAAACSSSDSEP